MFSNLENPFVDRRTKERNGFSLILFYLILSGMIDSFGISDSEFFALHVQFLVHPTYIYICVCIFVCVRCIFSTRSGRDHTFPLRSQLDPTQRDWIHGDWKSRYTVGRFAFFVTTVTILADNNNNKGGSCF